MASKVNFWALFGTELYLHDELEDELDIRKEEKLLALFTSRENAYEYVERSKAKTYSDSITWRTQHKGRQFVANSLLHGSTGFEIKPLEVPYLEIDPKAPA